MFACVGSNPTVNKVKNINTSDVAQRLACLAHNQKVGGSIPLVANYGSSQQFLSLHFIARGRRFEPCPNYRLGSSVVERVD